MGISSTCTVFAESEVISQLSMGTDKRDIINGIHQSVASRVAGAGFAVNPNLNDIYNTLAVNLLKAVHSEFPAAGIAANRDGEIMCQAAEDLGFDNDICGYARISLAYAAGKRASRKVDLETGEYVINPSSCLMAWSNWART